MANNGAAPAADRQHRSAASARNPDGGSQFTRAAALALVALLALAGTAQAQVATGQVGEHHPGGSRQGATPLRLGGGRGGTASDTLTASGTSLALPACAPGPRAPCTWHPPADECLLTCATTQLTGMLCAERCVLRLHLELQRPLAAGLQQPSRGEDLLLGCKGSPCCWAVEPPLDGLCTPLQSNAAKHMHAVLHRASVSAHHSLTCPCCQGQLHARHHHPHADLLVCPPAPVGCAARRSQAPRPSPVARSSAVRCWCQARSPSAWAASPSPTQPLTACPPPASSSSSPQTAVAALGSLAGSTRCVGKTGRGGVGGGLHGHGAR